MAFANVVELTSEALISHKSFTQLRRKFLFPGFKTAQGYGFRFLEGKV